VGRPFDEPARLAGFVADGACGLFGRIRCTARAVAITDVMRRCLNVQALKFSILIKIDAGWSPDFTACCGWDRAGRNQNEILNTQAVRIGYCRGDLSLEVAEPLSHLLVGPAPLLEFDDRDELLRVTIHDRDGGDSAS
jgi:hypothetical protein